PSGQDEQPGQTPVGFRTVIEIQPNADSFGPDADRQNVDGRYQHEWARRPATRCLRRYGHEPGFGTAMNLPGRGDDRGRGGRGGGEGPEGPSPPPRPPGPVARGVTTPRTGPSWGRPPGWAYRR